MVAVHDVARPTRPYSDTPWARFLIPRFERAHGLRAFAAQIGVQATTVEGWLYEGKEPRVPTIRQIAGRFGLTPHELARVIFGEDTEEMAAAAGSLQAEMAEQIDAIQASLNDMRRRLGR